MIDRKTDRQKLMVNIGGGNYYRRHWKVLDFNSPKYNFQMSLIDYNFDLTSNDRLPFLDNLVSFFYSSHTLEHIPQECCQHILDEIFRCLKTGGAVRFTMPDFDLAYEAFTKNSADFFTFTNPGKCAEENFLDFFASYMKDKLPYEKLRSNFSTMSKEDFANYYIQQIPRESQRKSPGNHINWWNYEKLSSMLRKAGFQKIYRSAEQGSRFVEMRGKGIYWGFDSTKPEVAFFAEAVK